MEKKIKKNWMQLLIRASQRIDNQVSGVGYHSSRVAFWAKHTARKMKCDDAETNHIFWAAMLHDVGKMGVPPNVLSKAGPLDADEWALIRLHPVMGACMVQSFRGLGRIAPIIQSHQEKFDGSGYPEGLSGSEIPLGARILAVVDAYDAMTCDRVYRKAPGHQRAIAELKLLEGQHFDPYVVQAFLEVLSE
jgi:putative nucleotidyltransferase with HDIG domain